MVVVVVVVVGLWLWLMLLLIGKEGFVGGLLTRQRGHDRSQRGQPLPEHREFFAQE